MSKGEESGFIVDGRPVAHEEVLRDLDDEAVALLIAFKAIDYFAADNEGGLVTWIDSEDEWDGHALALKHLKMGAISLIYFHINRDKKRLVKQANFGFEVPSDSAGTTGVDPQETDDMLRSASVEFDKNNFTYVSAMLAKAADIGMAYAQEHLDDTIKGVLIEEKLPELAELFPKEQAPILPYASAEFLEAVEDVVVAEGLSGEFDTIHLRRTWRDSSCIVSLQFHHGELVFGYFIQHSNKKHLFELHNYEEYDPYDEDQEGWDQSLLIRTIQTGIQMDDDAFQIYLDEATTGAVEDKQEEAESYVTMLKKRKRI